MALENQPLFQAPTIPPKMGRTMVSSSVFSNVAKTTTKPSLRRSSFSFVRGIRKQQEAQPEKLKTEVVGTDTSNISTTLIETNRILVEIQKQLALDFASRITEKKQLLEVSRRSVLKQKAVKKEDFVERGKQTAQAVLSPFKQVIAPAKSIFDKLIEFVTIVGGGILLNTAWTWLSDKKNQEKLNKVFKFLTDNWKLIVGIGIGVKLFGIVRTIRTAFSILTGALKLLGKALKFLRGPRRPPGQPPDPRPPGTQPPGTQPPGGCPPLNCITSKVGEIAKSVVEEMQRAPGVLIPLIPYIFGLPEFQRVLGEKVKERGGPITAQEPGGLGNFTEKFRQATSFMDPLLNPIEKVASSPATMVLGGGFGPQVGRIGLPLLARIPGLARFFGGASTAAAPAAKAVRPQINLGSSTSSPIAPQARGIGADFSISTGSPKVSRPVQTPSKNPIQKKYPSTNPIGASPTKEQIKEWAIKIGQRAKKMMDDPKIYDKNDLIGTRKRLLKIYGDQSTSQLIDRAAARNILNRKIGRGGFGLDLPEASPGVNPLTSIQRKGSFSAKDKELLEAMGYDVRGMNKGGTIKASNGMTVPGRGSGSVDSVPAMLAPGEEVIKTSSANLFRPLLKDINDNAGRMWSALSNAIGLQSRNNLKQEEVNTKFESLIGDFNKELDYLITQKKLKELGKGGGRGGGSMRKPVRPLKKGKGGGTDVFKPKPRPQIKSSPKSIPTSIQTYNVKKRSSSNGQPTVINMPMPAVNLAGNRTPESPNTNVQESAYAPISIVSFDTGNPYISEAFASYGIFI